MKIGDLVCVKGSQRAGIVLKISKGKVFNKDKIVSVFFGCKNNTEFVLQNSLKVVKK